MPGYISRRRKRYTYGKNYVGYTNYITKMHRKKYYEVEKDTIQKSKKKLLASSSDSQLSHSKTYTSDSILKNRKHNITYDQMTFSNVNSTNLHDFNDVFYEIRPLQYYKRKNSFRKQISLLKTHILRNQDLDNTLKRFKSLFDNRYLLVYGVPMVDPENKELNQLRVFLLSYFTQLETDYSIKFVVFTNNTNIMLLCKHYNITFTDNYESNEYHVPTLFSLSSIIEDLYPNSSFYGYISETTIQDSSILSVLRYIKKYQNSKQKKYIKKDIKHLFLTGRSYSIESVDSFPSPPSIQWYIYNNNNNKPFFIHTPGFYQFHTNFDPVAGRPFLDTILLRYAIRKRNTMVIDVSTAVPTLSVTSFMAPSTSQITLNDYYYNTHYFDINNPLERDAFKVIRHSISSSTHPPYFRFIN
ncbi:hypothetical protein WA158_005680 [Blastocystis sp. Blastoise]